MLKNLGVEKGDRVIIYMPMIPQVVFAMLACARIGAVHSVVFGGFASHELAIRIDDATPKVILAASCGIEIKKVIPYKPILDAAIEADKLQALVEQANQQSFNCITVDGDTSTSDTVLTFATGAANNDPNANLDDFARALNEVMFELAMLIVKDGEGEFECPSRVAEGIASGELPASTATITRDKVASELGLLVVDDRLEDLISNVTTFVIVKAIKK